MGKKVKRITILAIILLLIVFLKQLASHHISSVDEFQAFMESYGMAGPVFLTVIQALQVIIPILPGYLGCVVGAVSYGTMTGFWCNYIGISAGSIIAFLLARKFGVNLIVEMFSEEKYEKWKGKLEKKKSYEVFLFIATLLPLFPDDFLCYFSGLVGMKKHRFIWIILLGKPWCILVYSIIFGLV